MQNPPVEVILYSRPGCHLCDDVVALLERLRSDLPHRLIVIDITSDVALEQAYGERIPVVQVGEAEVTLPISEFRLRRLLRRGANGHALVGGDRGVASDRGGADAERRG